MIKFYIIILKVNTTKKVILSSPRISIFWYNTTCFILYIQ